MKYLSLLKSENTHQGELSKLPKGGFDSFGSERYRQFSKNDNSNPAPDLPIGCPLRGGVVPRGCRFDSRFFKRMVSEGILPTTGGCPLLRVCKLVNATQDSSQPEAESSPDEPDVWKIEK
jgi:hypothetical protein